LVAAALSQKKFLRDLDLLSIWIEHPLAKTIRKMFGGETADEVGAAPGQKWNWFSPTS
jgi:hypothetical protein